MLVKPTELPGVLLLQPKVFGDNRGYFFESYRQQYTEHGVASMVQANVSRSARGVLRGLHFQQVQPQAKLISVLRGEVLDVAVDIRLGSPSFGQWVGHVLNDSNHFQLYIPTGFAHGFKVLSEEADLLYQCSDYWHPQSEVGILWNDPTLGIDWGDDTAILSPKDLLNVPLNSLSSEKLPQI